MTPGPRSTGPDDRFLRFWVFWVSIGAVVGLLAPALAQLIFAGSPVARPTLILAGAIEGTALGWTQATVLKVRVPALSRPRWVAATAIGAAAAWFIGLLPAEWAEVWQRWTASGRLIAGIIIGVLLLAVIGAAQWFELRRHTVWAGWWVPGVALSWCAGLVVAGLILVGVGAVGAVLAGLLGVIVSALVSGWLLKRILRHPFRVHARN